MILFDGQVAVVTGAGGGLGRVYAEELARRGACLVVIAMPFRVARSMASVFPLSGGDEFLEVLHLVDDGVGSRVGHVLDDLGRRP